MITARWTGLDEALRNVRALGEDIAREEVLEKALVDVGKPLREEIVRVTPRSKVAPHVADTFIVAVSKEDRSEGRSVVLVGPSGARGSVGFVAGFLEFGTSKMAPRPFIRPTWDAWRGGFVGALTESLQRHFERVVRKYRPRAAR